MRFAWRFAPRRSDQLTRSAPESQKVDLVTTTPLDYPQMLGPERNGNVPNVAIDPDWTSRPPKQLWKQAIGAGWAGIAIVNGFAVTLEQRGPEEWVSCYEVKSGALHWASALKERHEHIPGGVGPRSTPTIHKGKVYALGATGKLRCLDGATGKILWQKDLLLDFGITPDEEREAVHWGRAASPLILGDKVIVPAGGKTQRASLVAYHVDTGDKIWEGGEHNVGYSSPTRAVIDGVEQVLIVCEDFAAGHDAATGQQLWQFDWPGKTSGDANVSDMIQVAPEQVFLSKGYGVGAALMKVARDQKGWNATPVWKSQRVLRTKFSNVVIKDGYVYGLSDGRLECAELATGKKQWKEGNYGYGQNLRVGDYLVLLSEEGEVVLIELSPEQPNHVLGRFQAIEGTTWNNFAISGPYLVVRNAQEMACFELPLKAR
jgi:outer membrane protein assembly factor BamB